MELSLSLSLASSSFAKKGIVLHCHFFFPSFAKIRFEETRNGIGNFSLLSNRMFSDPNDKPIILYACVAKGPTVLAEIYSSASAAGDLAAQCLAVAPRFHRLYSHTAASRIYAFLIEDPLIFFAIADESLGKPQILLFLHRLRDAFLVSSATAIVGADDHLSPLCFQGVFVSELRRLVRPLSLQADNPPPSPPADPPPPSASGSESEKETPKETKKKKKRKAATEENSTISIASYDSEAESRVEISAIDADPRTKTVQGVWGQHFRTVVLIDLAFCSLLFGIWLSVCRGFHCIGI